MAWDDPYLTVDEFKARIGIQATNADDVLLGILKGASRQVDNWCGRRFNQSDADSVRYFTARAGDMLALPDTVSLSEIATDTTGSRVYATVWETTDYDLYPFDAADIDWPYTELRVSPYGTLRFPDLARSIRLTGVFGWPAVPDTIREATALQANRLWARKNAPFGIVGSAELGQMTAITSLDPDVRAMIAPYKVVTV